MTGLNFAQARYNMVEQQVRPWEVLDQHVLDLMQAMPREHFVPDAYRGLAYADTCIPLGHGETMLSPKLEGRIMQAVAIGIRDNVLEIGTGSGYLTSLLANAGQHVRSVDIVPEFTRHTASRLAGLGINNVSLETGDGLDGWRQHAPYDVIVIGGSLPVFRPALQEQLNVGGRLFVVIGNAPVMEARLITRIGEEEWRSEALFETELPPLRGALQPPAFVF
jgi:protein-L-isoaspartate(D-aspartate) O-methyltransferase